ncbi:MAG TPA: dihydrolipoyl dehydrogenase [Planctomycetota bacterium]|jgi:dihydrolipoamide dehydrogenase
MSQHFQIAVIGSGPGGYIAALKAGQLGASVAVIEKSHLGGTCLNHGCIPSKALLASAELRHHAQRAAEFGIEIADPIGVNWPKIQARKDKVLAMLRGGIKSLFGGRKVTLFQGSAALNGPGKIVCTGASGATEITADKIILAVGSVPARIPGWPADPELVCTSDEALHWKTLPKKLLIVGGGVIGCEFACMMQALDVEVTVVEMLPKLLPNMDGQIGDAIEKIFTKRGIKCFANTKIDSLTASGAGVKASLSNGQTIEADRALVATGRKPNTADINLASVGIAVDRGFIRVNDQMETPVKGYYCIGDANGRCLLAHAASAHGVVAVENALGHATNFTAPVPNCVYTFPEIGSVGITSEEAAAKNIPVSTGNFPIGFLGKAMAVGDVDGFSKIIRHRETGELLGVHILGHNATECIAAAGAMLHKKATVQELAEVVFAHPTISEAIKESAEDALGAALHLPPRKVLRVTVGS